MTPATMRTAAIMHVAMPSKNSSRGVIERNVPEFSCSAPMSSQGAANTSRLGDVPCRRLSDAGEVIGLSPKIGLERP